jgi:3-methyl-2-oxobutanoate hydroxymethyltransferase
MNDNKNNEKHRKSITVPDILSRKNSKEKISVVTAYDFTFARLFEEAGIDIILIGDSLSSVIQGNSNTLPVTLEQVIYHSKCVTAALKRSLSIADMPFMSYQPSKEKALEAAGRLLKEGGVSAVKLEGGIPVVEIIEHIVSFDIPVMGHVGLTPQSYHRMGGHKVQGKSHDNESLKAGTFERILQDALAVEKAGAFALVIECVPAELAEEITAKVSIPTIGIGAGRNCDGQVLVMHDLLGLEDRKQPKFVKRYADLAGQVRDAAEKYIDDVKNSVFPADEHTFDDHSISKTGIKTKLKLV